MNPNFKHVSLNLWDGTMSGIVQCELTTGGTGYCVYRIPRQRLPECDCTEMEELNQSGVYFLLGEKEGRLQIYVGQGAERKNGGGVLARVLRHEKDHLKDDWDTAIICVGANLDIGRICYLEWQFYHKAQDAGRYLVLNKQEPSGRTRDRSVIYGMQDFMQVVDLMLEVLGCKIFEPVETIDEVEEESHLPSPEMPKLPDLDGSEYVLTRIIGKKWKVCARCRFVPDAGYVVLKGSFLAPKAANRPSLSASVLQIREVYASETDVTHLKDDVAFSSMSSAAAFVVGNTVNGPEHWKPVPVQSDPNTPTLHVGHAPLAPSVLTLQRLVGKIYRADARGYENGSREFVVMKGSRIVPPAMSKPHLSASLRRLREQARVDVDNRLLEDYTFSSPSTAACFVVGNSVNGLIEWMSGDKMLKELRLMREFV